MLSEQQLKAVELLLGGEHTVKAIAKECEVSRTTMYAWMEKEEFKEKLREMSNLQEQFLREAIKGRVNELVDRLEDLSRKSKNEMVKLNATKELLSHGGWNSNVQDINIKDDRQQDNKNELMEMWKKKKAGGSL
jgi:transposase-like protein